MTPTNYTRYSARVQPANLTVTEATELVETAAAGADGSDNDLQSWLWESGGSWSEVSVTTLEVEVVEEFNVPTSASSGVVSDASEGSEEGGDVDDPLIIGGIVAGAVLVVGLVMLALCRSKKASKKSRGSQAASCGRRFDNGDARGNPSSGKDSKQQQQQQQQRRGNNAGAEELVLRNADDDKHTLEYSGGSGGRSVGKGAEAGAAVTGAAAAGGASEARVFVPVDLGVEEGGADADAGAGASAAAAVAAAASEFGSGPPAAIAHQQRQQQRQEKHRQSRGEDSSSSPPGGEPFGRGAHSSAAAAVAAGSASGGSGPVGSQRSISASPPVATVDTTSLSAQDSSAEGSVITGAAAGRGALVGPSGGPGQHHSRRSSSTCSFAANNSSLAVRDAVDLETKRPRVRGPSGALATLGFARGCSWDVFEEDNTAGGNPSEGGEDGGSMYDGGSEAGSRYTPSRRAASGSAIGSARQAEVFGSQHSTAEARIQELRDRQGVEATPVTFPASMSMPSPGGPVTPGTDWDLAQGIAPSPGPNGRRRTLMIGRQNRSRSRSKGRRGGGSGSGRTSMDGGEGTSGDRSSSRPPSSRGSSVSRGAADVGSSSSSSAGGGGDGGDNSSSPARSRGFRRRGTPGRAGTRGSPTTPGGGGRGGEDSDSNSVFVEDSKMMAGAGGQEERRRRRQGVVNHPAEPCDDSEGESRFNDGATMTADSGDDISLLRSSLTLV
ncbi:unnamed protein product [Ectocarpus sp. CCAP 1310/34]|nr:unnamed protein product [Ectocarpus sp. CCAP 1310/34]